MTERATDAILLRRFAENHEEAAFAELVERHGPLVRRVCRRFLRREHDVEDVFQTTFLLLSMRASDVVWRGSIGGWVSEAARRLSLNARSRSARRSRREVPVSSLSSDFRFGDAGPLPDPECPLSAFTEEVERREIGREVLGAVGELPEKYRDPLVLCYLEGMSNHEAAAALGYPVGSISRRLDRARSLLRKGLIGRGVTLGALLTLLGVLTAWPLRNGPSTVRVDVDPARTTTAGALSFQDQAELRELFASLKRNDGTGLDAPRMRLGVLHAEEAARIVPTEARLKLPGFAVAPRKGDDVPDRPTPAPAASAPRLLETCVRCHVAMR